MAYKLKSFRYALVLILIDRMPEIKIVDPGGGRERRMWIAQSPEIILSTLAASNGLSNFKGYTE